MKLSMIAGAGLLALAAAATPAAAVTGSGLQGATTQAASTLMVEKAHGWHRACRLGRWGWHRHSYRWGRVRCRPWWY